MNEYYARRYKGRLIVRFDDTNPSKEKEEFQSSIIEDLAMLGVKPDVVTFTSDYFETIKGYALQLMQNGMAYMDDTPQEQMRDERMNRTNSKHRDQSYEDCIKYFKLMSSGDEEGAKWCLRAKIDMQSNNGTMRDPVLYRQNSTPHHRSGTEYKVYPTYDLACPIVDSIEGVTHALRTTEYNDRDEQYHWIQTALDLRRVRVHSFARMNFINTVLSKRKLTWFVENNHVTGWDDARFPTVRGVIRRGLNIDALRSFICAQGASRNVVVMEWKKFWAENKKEIDKYAKRFMAIDKSENTELIVTNGPEESENAFASTEYLPKDKSFGKRLIRLSKNVLLENGDIEGVQVGEEIVLMRWGVVKITKVDGGLEGEYIPDGNFKKAKRKLSWIANIPSQLRCTLYEFDNLISKDKLEENDKFEDFINPDTLAETEVIGDFGLKSLQRGEIIQLERRGYFRVDQPYSSEEKGLQLFTIPDGKAKSMGGLAGKLAHR
jgi:glutamyl-tRNA synthetase